MSADRQPDRVLMTADTVGGVWTYAVELVRALPAVEFTLATMGAPLRSSQRDELASLTNVRIHESTFKLEWMDNPWSDVDRAGEWLLELAADFRSDLIHLNGFAHGALPWSAPTIVVAHSCVLSWWRAVKGNDAPAEYDEYRERVTAGLRAADLVVAPTAAMLESLRDNYAVETNGRVIPNARNHEHFAPGLKSPQIFAAGRVWDEAKNIAVLDRVAPHVRWPINVAGDTTHPSRGASRLGNVRLLGVLPPRALAQRFAEAAIYAAPALYEPFGLSILEAALSACALVLSDIPSLRELWEDAAVFVPATDEDAIIRAFDALISNPVRREELGLHARERGLQFTTERMAAGYRAAYSACCANVEVAA